MFGGGLVYMEKASCYRNYVSTIAIEGFHVPSVEEIYCSYKSSLYSTT